MPHFPIPHRAVTALSLLPLMGCLGCAANQVAIPLEVSEQEVRAVDVPSAALARLQALADPHELIEIEREDRGSFIAYEGEWIIDGLEHEATVLADGSIVETESDLAAEEFSSLPAAIRAEVDALRAAGYVVTVARRSFIVYEVQGVRPGGPGEEDESDGEEIERLLLPHRIGPMR